MSPVRARKINEKANRDTSAVKLRQRRETIDMLLHGLDMLAAHAENVEMGTAARIFYTAREELVHWAVNMNFHESPQERFINRRLYDNRLSAVQSFIARTIRDAGTRLDSGAPKAKARHAK